MENSEPLIDNFIGKNVTVDVDRNFQVKGQLLFYSNSQNKPFHTPNILILKNESGKHILRGNWTAVKTFTNVKGE